MVLLRFDMWFCLWLQCAGMRELSLFSVSSTFGLEARRRKTAYPLPDSPVTWLLTLAKFLPLSCLQDRHFCPTSVSSSNLLQGPGWTGHNSTFSHSPSTQSLKIWSILLTEAWWPVYCMAVSQFVYARNTTGCMVLSTSDWRYVSIPSASPLSLSISFFPVWMYSKSISQPNGVFGWVCKAILVFLWWAMLWYVSSQTLSWRHEFYFISHLRSQVDAFLKGATSAVMHGSPDFCCLAC